jgi:hypothetical protein
VHATLGRITRTEDFARPFFKAEARSPAKLQTFMSAKCTFAAFRSVLLFVQNANRTGLFPDPHAFSALLHSSFTFQAAASPHLSGQLIRAFFQILLVQGFQRGKTPFNCLAR